MMSDSLNFKNSSDNGYLSIKFTKSRTINLNYGSEINTSNVNILDSSDQIISSQYITDETNTITNVTKTVNFNDYDVSTCGQNGSSLQNYLNTLQPEYIEFPGSNINTIQNGSDHLRFWHHQLGYLTIRFKQAGIL